MKQHKEVFNKDRTDFVAELNRLAKEDWRIVPGCYQVIFDKEGKLTSFVLMELEVPDEPVADSLQKDLQKFVEKNHGNPPDDSRQTQPDFSGTTRPSYRCD